MRIVSIILNENIQFAQNVKIRTYVRIVIANRNTNGNSNIDSHCLIHNFNRFTLLIFTTHGSYSYILCKGRHFQIFIQG